MEFSLGDPSGDGHRYSETFYIRSNYSSKDIEKIYEEACKMLEFDYVKEAANEYEYQNLDKKYVDKLIESGIIDKNDDLIVKEDYNHYYYGNTGDISFDEKEDYIKLFFDIIEKYCLINNKHIKLTNAQKKFLVWLSEHKNSFYIKGRI